MTSPSWIKGNERIKNFIALNQLLVYNMDVLFQGHWRKLWYTFCSCACHLNFITLNPKSTVNIQMLCLAFQQSPQENAKIAQSLRVYWNLNKSTFDHIYKLMCCFWMRDFLGNGWMGRPSVLCCLLPSIFYSGVVAEHPTSSNEEYLQGGTLVLHSKQFSRNSGTRSKNCLEFRNVCSSRKRRDRRMSHFGLEGCMGESQMM